jgi:hypothetical protein
MKTMWAALAAAMVGVSAQAATVDWKVSGGKSDVGKTVYVLTSIAESYASLSDLAAAAVSSGSVIDYTRVSYADGTASGDSVTKEATFYYAIVSGDDASYFNYVEATGMNAQVYDMQNLEPAKDPFNSIKVAGIESGTRVEFGANPDAPTGPSDSVPEPTSALLFVVGAAGLALRRRTA